jgi:hypothetical protein
MVIKNNKKLLSLSLERERERERQAMYETCPNIRMSSCLPDLGQ